MGHARCENHHLWEAHLYLWLCSLPVSFLL